MRLARVLLVVGLLLGAACQRAPETREVGARPEAARGGRGEEAPPGGAASRPQTVLGLKGLAPGRCGRCHVPAAVSWL
jgi:hypothetical protein